MIVTSSASGTRPTRPCNGTFFHKTTSLHLFHTTRFPGPGSRVHLVPIALGSLPQGQTPWVKGISCFSGAPCCDLRRVACLQKEGVAEFMKPSCFTKVSCFFLLIHKSSYAFFLFYVFLRRFTNLFFFCFFLFHGFSGYGHARGKGTS